MGTKKINLCNLLFLISIFLFELANYGKNTTIINPIASLLCYIALYISLINLLITTLKLKFKIKQFIILILLIIFSCAIYIKTNDYIFMEMIALIITATNMNFDEIIKKDFKFRIFIFIFILLCYIFGLVHKTIFFRETQIRYAFGFNHPNTFAFFILILFWEFIYINKNKLVSKKTLIYLLGTLLLLELSDSRTSELAVIIFTIITLINKKKPMKNNKVKDFLIQNLFIILTIISLVITISFNQRNNYIIELNKILSSRIWMQEFYYLRYPINLIGNNISYVYTIDDVYFKTIINYGIIGIIAMNHIYSKMLKISKKNQNKLVYNFIIVLLIYGLMEWYIIRPVLNIILFYYSSFIFNKVGEKNEK